MVHTDKHSSFAVDFPEIVHAVEFMPFECESQLIAIGGQTRISVGYIKLPDDPEVTEVYTQLREFHHGKRVISLSWSPETSMSVIPRIVKFAAVGGDEKISLYHSNLKDEDIVNLLEGHTSYVNDVSFDCDRGEKLASVGDDNTCRVWSSQGRELACFSLGAPGMSVCWHQQEPFKVLVAQKNGIIRIYCTQNNQPIMSLDTCCSPLMSADWCLQNSLFVGAAAKSEWMLFDTSRSSLPILQRQCHSEGAKTFKWSKCNECLVASTGRPGCQIKVSNTQHDQTLVNTSVPISNGLSWHYHLPMLVAGGDKTLHIWMIKST